MNVDKFDLAILKVLQEDARASLQAISERVGLSSTPCWTRIKRMESEGVIQGYTVKVNPLAIGLTDTVIVQVTLESHTDETCTNSAARWRRSPRCSRLIWCPAITITTSVSR